MNKDVEEINKIFEKFELLDKDNNYIDKLDIPENKIKILGIDFKNYKKIIRLYEKILLKNSDNNFLRSIILSILNELCLNKIFHKQENSELDFLIMRNDIFNELKILNKYLIEIFDYQSKDAYKKPKLEYIKIKI